MNPILMTVLEAAASFGPVVARTVRSVVSHVLEQHPELRVAPKDMTSEVADVHSQFLDEVAEKFPDTAPTGTEPPPSD